jgi:hypothetical protein
VAETPSQVLLLVKNPSLVLVRVIRTLLSCCRPIRRRVSVAYRAMSSRGRTDGLTTAQNAFGRAYWTTNGVIRENALAARFRSNVWSSQNDRHGRNDNRDPRLLNARRTARSKGRAVHGKPACEAAVVPGILPSFELSGRVGHRSEPRHWSGDATSMTCASPPMSVALGANRLLRPYIEGVHLLLSGSRETVRASLGQHFAIALSTANEGREPIDPGADV